MPSSRTLPTAMSTYALPSKVNSACRGSFFLTLTSFDLTEKQGSQVTNCCKSQLIFALRP